ANQNQRIALGFISCPLEIPCAQRSVTIASHHAFDCHCCVVLLESPERESRSKNLALNNGVWLPDKTRRVALLGSTGFDTGWQRAFAGTEQTTTADKEARHAHSGGTPMDSRHFSNAVPDCRREYSRL